MKKQPRDNKGRFLSWNGKRNKRYTLKDVEHAFYDGMNNSGGFYSLSKKWELYKNRRGLEE